MATSSIVKKRIKNLRAEFERSKKNKDSLLKILDETEVSESVYNSNSIENSTLTLKETEKILMKMEVSRDVSIREIFEAKNLAYVIEYVREKSQSKDLDEEVILFLHKMLMSNINENIAGRFRKSGEYVQVGGHIGLPPEKVKRAISEILINYKSESETYFIDRIAKFHLDFEATHPFIDGNGRIGRVIINYQLNRLGFPPIIVRDKEKYFYYQAFDEYNNFQKTKKMEKIISLGVMESLHKRMAYLRGQKIVKLANNAKEMNTNVVSVLNSAKRQTIPAFREKGIWKIGLDD